MNANWLKFTIVLVIIVIIEAGIGCIDTPVKVQPTNSSQIIKVEGGEEIIRQEVNNEWEILTQELPQFDGIDFFKNAGYGITKVTFQYSPTLGKGIILHRKNDNDYLNKSKADYYVSGIRLLLKKGSGEVHDTGMIIFQKDETAPKSISVPKEKFIRFKVEEVVISPRN